MSEQPAEPTTIVLPLRGWLAVSHLVVLLLPVVGLIVSGALAQDLVDQTRWDLENQAALLAMVAEEDVREARGDDPDALLTCCTEQLSSRLRYVKAKTRSGIEVTDTRGVVVATSGSELGQDLSDERHVRRALAGVANKAVKPRPAPSRAQPLSSESRRARVRVFVAQPVVVDGDVVGAIVISRTPREELQAFYQMAPRAIWGAVPAFLATLAVAWGAGILATRSLKQLDRGAVRIAEGDYGGIEELALPQRSHVADVARVARSITRMATRLRERIGYIGEFASNVSHEFKTPLSTLRGTVELLGDEESMPAAQRERFLTNAASEVNRLEKLVEGLLSLARADQAQEHVPVDLNRLLAEVAPDVAVIGAAGVVHGDRSQLQAVVGNLLDNAREHGGTDASVQLEAFERGEVTGFAVVDDGPGISEANLARVFDRFFTTERGRGGTGIGLALVRAIVEQHGGEVSVESRPGRTVFRVSLPRVPAPA